MLYLFANILTYEDSFLLPRFIVHLCGVSVRTAARCCWVGLDLKKFSSIKNVTQIPQMGAELIYTYIQTDVRMDSHDEAKGRYSRLCKRL